MTETLTIRTAVPGDLTALDTLYGRAYPRLLKADYPPSILVTAVPIIARAQPALLASGTFYVAETPDGTLVGAGGWTPRRDGRGEVRHVVTSDRAVRRGIGRAILSHVIAEARATGLAWLDCSATHTAVPFYEAMGFRSLGPVTLDLRPGIVFPAVRMLRPL